MSARVDTSFFGIHEEIILTKEGVWLSNGEEITHGGTVRAFSKNLFRCKEGFEIRLGNEKKVIHVEDTIYFIVGASGDPTQGFELRLNDQRLVHLNPTTLQYRPGRLTCKVEHPNDQTHEEARFLSPAYYEILKYIEPHPKGFEITIEGSKVLLPDR
jgi:hypothetical protein